MARAQPFQVCDEYIVQRWLKESGYFKSALTLLLVSLLVNVIPVGFLICITESSRTG